MNNFSLKMFLFFSMITVLAFTQTTESSKARRAKLSLAEWPSYNYYEPNGPGTYAYGYNVDDQSSGNVQFKDEESFSNGTVKGSYGYVRPDGVVQITNYIADEKGYRSKTETKPLSSAGSVTQKPSSSHSLRPTENTIGSLAETSETISPEIAEQILTQNQISSNPAANPFISTNTLAPELAEAIFGRKPLAPLVWGSNFQTDKDKTVSFQLVNNFVPGNFPIIAFRAPIRQHQSQHQGLHDQLPTETGFINDKFHDPIVEDKRFRKPDRNMLKYFSSKK